LLAAGGKEEGLWDQFELVAEWIIARGEMLEVAKRNRGLGVRLGITYKSYGQRFIGGRLCRRFVSHSFSLRLQPELD
jgi:hypothetical protein